jgi:hypothetical protein
LAADALDISIYVQSLSSNTTESAKWIATFLDPDTVLVGHKLDLDVVLESIAPAKHDGNCHLATFCDPHRSTPRFAVDLLSGLKAEREKAR